MPRTADHPARRRQILDGVRDTAVRGGLGSVSIARAADAAGVSVGMVQHYYPTKQALLMDAFDDVQRAAVERVDTQIEASERQGARIEEMVVDSLEQFLPLDEQRRAEVYLHHAFAGLALENADLAEHLSRSSEALEARLCQALTNGKTCGEVETGLDVAPAATGLLALVHGLALRLLTAGSSADVASARAALRSAVAHACPGECRRHAS